MQFFKIIFSLAIVSMLASACGDTYKSTKSGLVYKIIPGSKKGKQVTVGTVVKFHVVVMQKDSVTYNSFGKIPAFAYVDSIPRNYDISEVLPLLHKGDSAVIVQSVDTIAKMQGGQLPPGLKKGDKIKILLRVLDLYDNIPIAQLMYNKENELQKERDIKDVEAYLSSKKIRTIKTPGGAFVEVIKQGEGALPDTGKQVFLKYTGSNFSGDKFDSNVDPAFGHTDTFKIVIGQMGSIPGFEDGLKQIAKGGKAKIYIPSMLGYGMQGAPPKIKPYEHLIFEVEMLDIQDVVKAVQTKKEKE